MKFQFHLNPSRDWVFLVLTCADSDGEQEPEAKRMRLFGFVGCSVMHSVLNDKDRYQTFLRMTR